MIRIRLKIRPWEIVEVYEHQLLDLQRWGMILEYVDEEGSVDEDVIVESEDLNLYGESHFVTNDSGEPERVLTFEELQEYFKDFP